MSTFLFSCLCVVMYAIVCNVTNGMLMSLESPIMCEICPGLPPSVFPPPHMDEGEGLGTRVAWLESREEWVC